MVQSKKKEARHPKSYVVKKNKVRGDLRSKRILGFIFIDFDSIWMDSGLIFEGFWIDLDPPHPSGVYSVLQTRLLNIYSSPPTPPPAPKADPKWPPKAFKWFRGALFFFGLQKRTPPKKTKYSPKGAQMEPKWSPKLITNHEQIYVKKGSKNQIKNIVKMSHPDLENRAPVCTPCEFCKNTPSRKGSRKQSANGTQIDPKG